jgi:high-affinity nickel-transport protein
VRRRTAAAKWHKKVEKATAVIWKTLLIASGLPGGSTRTRLLADVANGVVDANGVGQQAEAPVAAAQVLSPGIPKGVAMLELLPLLTFGLFLGMRHATDADHVIAVMTIVSRERSVWLAALIGSLWGMGHTLTIVVVGGAIILLGIVIPPRVGLSMEFSVAAMLVLLGVLNLTSILRWLRAGLGIDRQGHPLPHGHPHAHGDYVHSHPHGHEPDDHGHAPDKTPQAGLDRIFGRLGLYQTMRPLIVGVVHGLAGSAAVVLLVLATIRDPTWALGYLLVFGVGTIAGMMLITMAIAVPFACTAAHFARLNQYLGLASGLLCLGFGLFLAYQIGVVDGLFTANPRWTPE